MSKNKLDNVKKALTEIARREQERVDKQQKLGKFPIEASVLIIAKEALVDLEGVMDRLKSEDEEFTRTLSRTADILCFSAKYEERDTHEQVKKVLSRYLAALTKAHKENKLGEEALTAQL